jgi:hypothetical protein
VNAFSESERSCSCRSPSGFSGLADLVSGALEQAGDAEVEHMVVRQVHARDVGRAQRGDPPLRGARKKKTGHALGPRRSQTVKAHSRLTSSHDGRSSSGKAPAQRKEGPWVRSASAVLRPSIASPPEPRIVLLILDPAATTRDDGGVQPNQSFLRAGHSDSGATGGAHQSTHRAASMSVVKRPESGFVERWNWPDSNRREGFQNQGSGPRSRRWRAVILRRPSGLVLTSLAQGCERREVVAK